MQNNQQDPADGSTRRNLGRRGFLGLSALVAGGSALGGLDTVAGAPTDEQLFGTARWSTVRSILPDGDGYLLTGIRTNSAGEQVGWGVRLDDDFDVMWNHAYLSPPHLESRDRGEDHDGIEFALPDGDGGFLLVGWWHTLGSDSRYGWVSWVGSDGIPWLTRVYNREDVNSFRDDFADGVATDDGFLLVGRTIASEFLDGRSGDGWIVEIDGDRRGRVLWERAYDPNGPGDSWSDDEHHSEFNAVTAVDGGYLVVGETSPDGPSEDTNTAAWALRIDGDGEQRWSRTYRLDDGQDNEFRDVIAVDDGFLVAGVAGEEEYVRELHDYEMRGQSWAVKLDRQGQMIWEDAPGGDGFHAVEQRGNGAVFVGQRNGRGWSVAYGANGDRLGSDDSGVSESRYYDVAARPGDSGREFLPAGYGRRSGNTSGLLSRFDGLGSGNGGGDDDGDDEPEGRLFELVATERGEVRYEFTVDGSAEGVRVNNRIKSEDEDRIRENDDGTVTVTGSTGNPGYGDAFRITGEITEFSTSGEADFYVRIDGDRVDVDELGDGENSNGDGDDGNGDDDDNGDGDEEERLFELVATEVGEIRYEFVVDGDAEGVRVNSRVKAEDEDRVRANDDGTVTVTGATGNPGYGDAFRITGPVVEFESEGDVDFLIRLDGERVSVAELVED